MSVLCLEAVGESDNYVLYSKGTDEYTSNQPLDSNNDGKITKKEATQAVIDRRILHTRLPTAVYSNATARAYVMYGMRF